VSVEDLDQGEERSTLVHNSAWLFAAQVVGSAGFFVTVLVLARGLGPEGRGTIAFVIVTAMVLGRVARLGVSDATTVLAAQRPEARPTLLSNVLVFALLVGSLVGAFAYVSLFLLGDARPDGLGVTELTILAVGVPVAALGEAGYAFLLGCGRLRSQALVIGGASWVYALLLLIVWVAVGLTAALAALIWVVGLAIRALMFVWASWRGIGTSRPRLDLLFESFRFGIRAWFGSLARFLNFRADQILMGFLAPEAALGVYAVAVNAGEILLYLPEATALALLPLTATTPAESRPRQSLRAFRALATMTAASVLAGAVLGPLVIPAVFGSSFTASVGPFLWLLPGALGFAALGVFSNTLLASGYPGRSSHGAVVALTVGLALDLLLIPRYGANGAAVAASVAFLAGGAVAASVYRARAGFPWREFVAFEASDFALLGSARQALTKRVGRRGRAAGSPRSRPLT
jgi:O-antigen/teichoic acid export membrane protein